MFQTCNSSLKSPFGEWLINTTTTITTGNDHLHKFFKLKIEKMMQGQRARLKITTHFFRIS